MDDSNFYSKKRELINDAFEAGEIDFQQYVILNQKILKEYWAAAGKLKIQLDEIAADK